MSFDGIPVIVSPHLAAGEWRIVNCLGQQTETLVVGAGTDLEALIFEMNLSEDDRYLLKWMGIKV